MLAKILFILTASHFLCGTPSIHFKQSSSADWNRDNCCCFFPSIYQIHFIIIQLWFINSHVNCSLFASYSRFGLCTTLTETIMESLLTYLTKPAGSRHRLPLGVCRELPTRSNVFTDCDGKKEKIKSISKMYMIWKKLPLSWDYMWCTYDAKHIKHGWARIFWKVS
jgi:hypothetical protein